MVCQHCGCENLEEATHCVYCGEALPGGDDSVESIMAAFAGVSVRNQAEGEMAREAAGMAVLSAANRLRQGAGQNASPEEISEELSEMVSEILEESHEEAMDFSDQAAEIVNRVVEKLVSDEPEEKAPEAEAEMSGEESSYESDEAPAAMSEEEESAPKRPEPENPLNFHMEDVEPEADPEPVSEDHNFVLAAAEAVPAAPAVSIKERMSSEDETVPETDSEPEPIDFMPNIALTKRDELLEEEEEEDEDEEAKILRKLSDGGGSSHRGQKRGGGFLWILLLFIAALCLLYLFWLSPMLRYNRAVELMEAGDYRAALSEFEKNGNYKDSKKLADECIAKLGGDTEPTGSEDPGTTPAVTDPSGGTTASSTATDSETTPVSTTTQPPETTTQTAETTPEETTEEATTPEETTEEATTPEETTIPEGTTEAPVPPREVSVGEIISYGHYEQNGKNSDGKEAIEWIVLEVNDEYAIMISRYVLDAARFTNPLRATTYSGSDLRNWLNYDFAGTAFTEKEKAGLTAILFDPGSNPEFSGTNQGGAVADLVGILSIDAIKAYGVPVQCRATDYAVGRGVFRAANGFSPWWTSTMGTYSTMAALARSDGEINYKGRDLSIGTFGVRPVIAVRRSEIP